MLLQFAVENFLSFRERVVLSMLAVDGVEHSEEQIVRLPGLKTPVLKVAAVYGANASGKSNLLKALQFLRDLIAMGVRPGQRTGDVAFKLNSMSVGSPSRMEVELLLAGDRWSYGIEVRPERVESEWLYRHGARGAERMVFERVAGDGRKPKVELGSGLRLSAKRRAFFQFLAEGTRQEQPFLSECIERDVVELEVVFGWFRSKLGIVGPETEFEDLEWEIPRNLELRSFIQESLALADTGVKGLHVQIRLSTEAAAAQEAVEGSSGGGGVQPIMVVLDELRRQGGEAELLFRMGGEGTPFLGTSEQSDGTLRLVHLSAIFYVFSDPEGGDLLAIDELDRSLHTLLARQLVQRFLAQTAGRPAQLLFTTHDTNLLDLHLLPRDSIWFTEKDRSGGSTLYSLAEFKPEQLDALGANLEEGYLQGRFGAIPFLTDPRRTGWSSEG